jgi:N-acyl-D-amino-acid deacylase
VLERLPRVLDVGSSIAHGPLRAYVMGDRGAANEPATDADIVEMARHVEEALRAGAFGFTTSRARPSTRRRTASSSPAPTPTSTNCSASRRPSRRVGRGVFGFAPDHALVPVQEWPWMRKVAALTGQPVSVNLNQRQGQRGVARRTAPARRGPRRRPADRRPGGRPQHRHPLLPAGQSVHPLLFHPAYQEIAHLPMAERLVALAEPERRRRIIHDIPDDGGFFQGAVLNNLGRIWLVDDADIDYEPDATTASPRRAARAACRRCSWCWISSSPTTATACCTRRSSTTATATCQTSPSVTRHPHTRMGLSDGGAHCGAICDGGMPTFMLTHWTRDRTRGPKLPLEYVVHRQTSQTASLYGIADRGVVAPACAPTST